MKEERLQELLASHYAATWNRYTEVLRRLKKLERRDEDPAVRRCKKLLADLEALSASTMEAQYQVLRPFVADLKEILSEEEEAEETDRGGGHGLLP